MEYNLYAYCLNNPVNLKDEDGELPKWASNLIKIGIGAAAIGIGVAAAAMTGGTAIPVLVSSLKIAAVSGVVGGAIEAGGSAIKQRISNGSWKGCIKRICRWIL